MDDTDVLTADTVPAEPEALEEVTPDTAEGEATEGTDTEEQATDTRDFDAEIEAARKEAEENARKSFEEEAVLTAYRERARASDQWLATHAANEIRKTMVYAAETVDSGKATAAQVIAAINPDNLAKGLAGQLANAVQTEQLSIADQLQDRYLTDTYKDWRIPSDLIRQKEKALAERDTAALYRLRNEIIRRAVLENDVPKEAQKVAAEAAAKNKKAADVEKVRDGDKSRASAERPTAVSGGAAGKQDNAAIIANPSMPLSEKRAAFQREHGFAPNF